MIGFERFGPSALGVLERNVRAWMTKHPDLVEGDTGAVTSGGHHFRVEYQGWGTVVVFCGRVAAKQVAVFNFDRCSDCGFWWDDHHFDADDIGHCPKEES